MRSLFLAATMLASCAAIPLAHAETATPPATAIPAPSIPVEAGPMPAGKLDGSVVPSTYRLDLTIDPAKERFSGHVEIDATSRKASRFVWLHGKEQGAHESLSGNGKCA